jgi:PHD/YefM family antitoxin component YafN of YafNO toxin-antitoxin module
MSTVTIAEAREHLDELCASVAETGEPAFIEREGRTFMLVETNDIPPRANAELVMRILGTPENERSLRAAVARAREGKGIEMTVDELCLHVGMNEAKV